MIKTLLIRHLNGRQERCLYRERRLEERNGQVVLVLKSLSGKIENVFAVDKLNSWTDLDA